MIEGLRRPPLQVNETAPDFTLPLVNRDGTVSLSDYRGKRAVLLAIFRGLNCAFCRRHIVQLENSFTLTDQQVLPSTSRKMKEELKTHSRLVNSSFFSVFPPLQALPCFSEEGCRRRP